MSFYHYLVGHLNLKTLYQPRHRGLGGKYSQSIYLDEEGCVGSNLGEDLYRNLVFLLCSRTVEDCLVSEADLERFSMRIVKQEVVRIILLQLELAPSTIICVH